MPMFPPECNLVRSGCSSQSASNPNLNGNEKPSSGTRQNICPEVTSIGLKCMTRTSSFLTLPSLYSFTRRVLSSCGVLFRIGVRTNLSSEMASSLILTSSSRIVNSELDQNLLRSPPHCQFCLNRTNHHQLGLVLIPSFRLLLTELDQNLPNHY